MKGLLYKDLFLIRKNVITGMASIFGTVAGAVIIVLGMTVGNFQGIKDEGNLYDFFFKGFIFLVVFSGVFTALTSASAIDMDNKSEWYKVMYASPITIWQEILSRYILAFIVNTFMAVWSAVLLPFMYVAGDKNYGIGELKIIICCWLIGMLVIMLRLPVDIIFTAKVSTGIMIGFTAVVMIGLGIWLTIVEDVVIIIEAVVNAVDIIYNHAVVFTAGIVIVSFTVSYLGKRNRRWA